MYIYTQSHVSHLPALHAKHTFTKLQVLFFFSFSSFEFSEMVYFSIINWCACRYQLARMIDNLYYRLREDEIKKKTRATKVTNKFKTKKEPNPVKIALKQLEEHLQVQINFLSSHLFSFSLLFCLFFTGAGHCRLHDWLPYSNGGQSAFNVQGITCSVPQRGYYPLKSFSFKWSFKMRCTCKMCAYYSKVCVCVET